MLAESIPELLKSLQILAQVSSTLYQYKLLPAMTPRLNFKVVLFIVHASFLSMVCVYVYVRKIQIDFPFFHCSDS